jgi:hypothetical protein
MTEIQKLGQVIRDLHDVHVRHLGNATVHETFKGQTVWDGVVELFEVMGHETATRAYAWGCETDDGGRRYVAVLNIPPITSPVEAVRASIVADSLAGRH